MTRVRSPEHDGQSVVELAFISLIVVFLLAVTVDFSRAFSAHLTIGNMARAGAQAGSIGGVLGAEDAAETKNLIENAAYAEESLIFGGSPSVDSRLCVDTSGYELVQVRVTYDFQPLLAVGPIAGPYTLERKVELRAQLSDIGASFNEACF
jgi:Flp pilus assembly protein TadG